MKTKIISRSLRSSCLILCSFIGYTQQSFYIPIEIPTISEAVQLAGAGDTLFIGDGIYTDSVQIRQKHLVIVGNGKPRFTPENDGVSFDVTDANVEFWYLYFTDSENDTSPPNFGIKGADSQLTIKYCLFDRMFSPLSQMEGGIEVSNCQFRATRGFHAITQSRGTFLIYNNLITLGAYQGISIHRSHGSMFNNTLIGINPQQHFGIIINADAPSQIFNNIIANFGIGVLLSASDSTELNAVSIAHNNTYLTAAPYWYEYNESLDLPIYSGSFEPSPGTGEISEDPQFINILAEDYRLKSFSPCIDAGSSNYPVEVSTDLDGAARISGVAPDIGAYEWQSSVGIASVLPKIEFSIYPLPASTHLNVALAKPAKVDLLLYSLQGKLHFKKSYSFTDLIQLPLSVPPGHYYIQLSINGTAWTKKVLVQ